MPPKCLFPKHTQQPRQRRNRDIEGYPNRDLIETFGKTKAEKDMNTFLDQIFTACQRTYYELQAEGKDGHVFPVLSNQKMNDYINEIIAICNIDKEITWWPHKHCKVLTLCISLSCCQPRRTYTKHIYIGSQRVVSKIGDFDSYGSDLRRIQYAGCETDGLSVDYKVEYTGQLQVIKDNYTTFGVPYNGDDNNDYVDGKGFPVDIAGCTREFANTFAFHSFARQFCCNDGSLEAVQARAMARAVQPDHLGSSSYLTNLDGEVVQHIEYVPFGEMFIEERNNI